MSYRLCLFYAMGFDVNPREFATRSGALRKPARVLHMVDSAFSQLGDVDLRSSN